METIKLWARHGDAVRQAIELGELVHLDTAREELTDEFLLFAIQSGLLSKWAEAFPDPRQEPEINMEVRLLLDSRVVDVPMSYNPIVVTPLSWNTLFFNGLQNGPRFSDVVGVEDPGIQ